MRKYSKIYRTILLGVFSITVLFISVFMYSQSIKESYKEENINALKELTKQGTIILRNEVRNKQDLLRELAHDVSYTFGDDFHAAAVYLHEAASRNNFRRIGVARADGTAYTSDNQTINISEREYFQEALQGQNVVSDNIIGHVESENILVYAVPLVDEKTNNINGVLFATYSLDTFRNMIELNFFGGEGYSYLVREDGNVVVDSKHSGSFENFVNIYGALLNADFVKNKENTDKLKLLINNKQDGYIEFYNKEQKYLYCFPTGINNWALLAAISADVIEDKTAMVMNKTYWLGFLLLILFLAFLWHIMRLHTLNQKELMDMVYVDNVTGGYSLARFVREAKSLLKSEGKQKAFVALDIDGFKYFNDRFGYGEGNDLLKFVWRKLQENLQSEEILARETADNFIILLQYDTCEELEQRIKNICLQLAHYNTANGSLYKMSLSLGIYEINEEINEEFNEIISMVDKAHIAHQTIKHKGENAWAFYDDAIRSRLLREKEMEDLMEKALADGEFIAYYQPKYSAQEQELVGAEALVRWRRSDGSIIPPFEFIPLFERNGFINKIDFFMFAHVCKQQSLWLKQGLKAVPISVNMSRMCLYEPKLVEQYKKALNDNELSAHYVELELTESAFFENTNVMNDVIKELHKIGIRVLMDDFGTGYSSLMMLKDVPSDVLKIDKTFVDDIGEERDEKIILNIIEIAHSLQIEVTAEGVETEAQFEFLKSAGCDNIQGYYFAKPMPADDFTALLQAKKLVDV